MSNDPQKPKLVDGAVLLGTIPAGYVLCLHPIPGCGWIAVDPEHPPLIVDYQGVRPLLPTT